jgi:hypothetical protein
MQPVESRLLLGLSAGPARPTHPARDPDFFAAVRTIPRTFDSPPRPSAVVGSIGVWPSDCTGSVARGRGR